VSNKIFCDFANFFGLAALAMTNRHGVGFHAGKTLSLMARMTLARETPICTANSRGFMPSPEFPDRRAVRILSIAAFGRPTRRVIVEIGVPETRASFFSTAFRKRIASCLATPFLCDGTGFCRFRRPRSIHLLSRRTEMENTARFVAGRILRGPSLSFS